jgi:hypothetical protein
MKALRFIKNVSKQRISIDIPKDFGTRVEILIFPVEDEYDFWSDEEISNMGKIALSKELEIDDTDYSKW